MKKFKKVLSPLFLTFLCVLGFGLYLFTKDSGEEGWGYMVAMTICFFSLIPLFLDLILKALIKKKKIFLIVQIFITLLILVFYFKWS